MRSLDYISRYDSPLGGITLASDGSALVGLWFDGQRYFGSTLSAEYTEASLPVFDAAVRWLDAYFGGADPGFTPPIHLRGTPFQEKVWRALLTIPYGKTMTYGELSRRLSAEKGGCFASARAVGGAVSRNAVSLIVPCHRVVGADGSLTGYAGGMEKKLWLLQMEKAAVTRKNDGRMGDI
ncbi:MAG: methylated-DNA--[Clostridia bacterium]|nr:methylated-DNA--[protein]-cysteine S-methyltransferase [Clostridia bacterium]